MEVIWLLSTKAVTQQGKNHNLRNVRQGNSRSAQCQGSAGSADTSASNSHVTGRRARTELTSSFEAVKFSALAGKMACTSTFLGSI
jgi:hypothetical protein